MPLTFFFKYLNKKEKYMRTITNKYPIKHYPQNNFGIKEQKYGFR